MGDHFCGEWEQKHPVMTLSDTQVGMANTTELQFRGEREILGVIAGLCNSGTPLGLAAHGQVVQSQEPTPWRHDEGGEVPV